MMDKENKVQAQYNRMAEVYDFRWRGYVNATNAYLKERMKMDGHERILDVACGTGALEALLVSRYPSLKVTGIDISEKMLAVARKKLEAFPNVVFKIASASALPFSDEYFDKVVCTNSFHYFDRPKQSLTEMGRVLKTGGRIIVLDWCRDFLICRLCDLFLKFLDPAYKQCYTQAQLRHFFKEATFSILSDRKLRLRVIWGMMIVEAVKEQR